MNEIILAVLTFILGAIATILTQFLNHKWQLLEQRRQRRVERIHDIQKWVNSYRSIFQCQFPQLVELVLAHRYIKFDGKKFYHLKDSKDAFIHIRDEMRKFKALETKHKDIEKEAIFALRALGATSAKPNSIIRLTQFLLRQNIVYIDIANGFDIWYPKGFIKEIAPYLLELGKQKYKLFTEFPNEVFYHIDWEILDTIRLEQFSKLLIPRYSIMNPGLPEPPKQKDEEIQVGVSGMSFENVRIYYEGETQLLEKLDKMEQCRQVADRAIDNALLVIEKYKTEWL